DEGSAHPPNIFSHEILTRARKVKRPKGQSATVNRSGLARHFAVNLSTIDQWIAAGAPGTKNGAGWQFEIAAVERWKALRLEKNPNEPGLLSEARRRKAIADAELAEYELAEKRRLVVPIDEAVDVLTREFSHAREKLLAMPPRIAPLIVGLKSVAEARVLLDQAVTEILNELSGAPHLPNTGGNGRAHEASH
ncbi:MAG: hypothetical protein QOG85_2240, partial [Gaiellaceae bacterium]|nr:hypothetical protein [Gaiellaceae bacterium]